METPGRSRLEAHGWPVEGPSWRRPDEVTRVGPSVEVSGGACPMWRSRCAVEAGAAPQVELPGRVTAPFLAFLKLCLGGGNPA